MNARLVFWIVIQILVLFWSVQNILRLVRALNTARSSGIVKKWFNPRWVLFPIAALAAFIWSGAGFSQAAKYNKSLKEYELLGESTHFQNYIKEREEARTGVEVKDPKALIEKRKATLRSANMQAVTSGIGRVSLGVYLITAAFGGVWLFTEEGIVFCHRKIPEIHPITAELREGGIDVSLRDALVNEKKLCSFKQTPKNMAAFGRYVEWDNEMVQEAQPTNGFSEKPL